jgi:AcrR family transcriptional regulator
MATMTTHVKRVSTRDRVLDAAFDLFAEVGFAGTTVSEIERRVGLAAGSGSVYRHFPSKDELLPAAIEREFNKAFAAIEAGFPDGENPREQRAVWLRRRRGPRNYAAPPTPRSRSSRLGEGRTEGSLGAHRSRGARPRVER